MSEIKETMEYALSSVTIAELHNRLVLLETSFEKYPELYPELVDAFKKKLVEKIKLSYSTPDSKCNYLVLKGNNAVLKYLEAYFIDTADVAGKTMLSFFRFIDSMDGIRPVTAGMLYEDLLRSILKVLDEKYCFMYAVKSKRFSPSKISLYSEILPMNCLNSYYVLPEEKYRIRNGHNVYFFSEKNETAEEIIYRFSDALSELLYDTVWPSKEKNGVPIWVYEYITGEKIKTGCHHKYNKEKFKLEMTEHLSAGLLYGCSDEINMLGYDFEQSLENYATVSDPDMDLELVKILISSLLNSETRRLSITPVMKAYMKSR